MMLNNFFSKYKFVIVFFSLCSINTQAQKDTAFEKLLASVNLDELFGTQLPVKASTFKLKANYLTNYVYGGRKDTSTIYPYFTPGIEFSHKSGFFAGASFSFLTNDSSRLDATNLELGYSKGNLGRFNITGYVTKSFYNSNSRNVQSDIKWVIGSAVGYDAKILNINAAPSLMIGSQNDFALSLSIDKIITISEKEKYAVTLNPNITTYFGSTGFYQNTKVKGKRNNAQQQQQGNLTVTSPEKFQMLSYDLSLPLYYDRESWGFYFTPTYAIPVNPITTTYKITGPNGNLIPSNLLGGIPNPSTSVESISNTFFAEFGFYYKF